jgi:hypothetical protein
MLASVQHATWGEGAGGRAGEGEEEGGREEGIVWFYDGLLSHFISLVLPV